MKKIIKPGFIDSHTHLVGYGLGKKKIDISNAKSKEEAFEKIRVNLDKEEKDIIIAINWDESKWEKQEFPTRRELDAINREVPIILRRICGHIAVCNTPALKKIPKKYPIEMESGIISEEAVLYIDEVFPPSYQDIKEAIVIAQDDMLKLGIIGVNDIMTPEYFRAYKDLDKEGMLKLRVRAFINDTHISEIEELKDGTNIKLGGIKTFLDGSIGARTAALREFTFDNGKKGVLIHSDKYLLDILLYAEDRDYQVIMHAIGDRAISQALDVISNFPDGNRLKHRIEHFELATDEDIERAVDYNVILSMQPNFIRNWSLPGGMYSKRFKKNFEKNNRIGKIYKLGGIIVFGSDGMPYSPLYGIESVVHAPFKEQRINIETAIKLYTENGLYVSGWDDLDWKSYSVKIDDKGIAETVISGDVVYRRVDA